jgi:hypothetical protein
LAEDFSAVEYAVFADVDFVPVCRKPGIPALFKVGPFDCIPMPVVEVLVLMGAGFCYGPPLTVLGRRLIRSGDLWIGFGQKPSHERDARGH